MSRLIGLQYDMVKKAVPDAVCSTNLYGENIELYKKGYLRLPEDVIKIWADNGYGEMVSRRQNNHNPRIYSLPAREDFGRHGIYYHVSFYDLQAANHMTMLPNSPEFVRKKLLEAMKSGAGELWIINGSNIKPHVYFLDLIARIWKDGDVDVTQDRMDYVESYYGKNNAVQIAGCLKAYKDYALAYGPHQDDHAGEQFSNHVARILICQFMKNKTEPSQDLLWATKAETLSGQIAWYKNLCQKAANGYKKYLRQCEETACMLDKETEVLFRDSILLQVQIHFYCFSGAYKVCLALESALDGNEQKAFYCAGKARKDYLFGNSAMRNREHGKWHNFYANECLTDIKQTAWVLRSLMAYIRTMDDGPHYYKWQRDFLYSEEDRRVMLIMNMENHLEDLEIFELMEERWG